MNGSAMWLFCILCVLASLAFAPNNLHNPSNSPYDSQHTSDHLTSYSGQQLQIRIREPDHRNQYNCEPYEDMFVDDDECRIYCMVNGKIGNVVVRDRVRRSLHQCVPSSNPCSLCRRRVAVNGLSQNINASLPGRCTDDCRCLATQISSTKVHELMTECIALKNMKFQPVRKATQGDHVEGFEINFPTAERRDPTRCEPYETTTYNLPVGTQEVYDLQCRTYCVISGTIGTIVVKSVPRVLGYSVNNQCRQPIGASLLNSIEVQGSQEQQMGFCQKGTCGQLSRSNLRPKRIYARQVTAAQIKDTKSKKEVSVSEVDGGISVDNN